MGDETGQNVAFGLDCRSRKRYGLTFLGLIVTSWKELFLLHC